jgi:hypothetical protein
MKYFFDGNDTTRPRTLKENNNKGKKAKTNRVLVRSVMALESLSPISAKF